VVMGRLGFCMCTLPQYVAQCLQLDPMDMAHEMCSWFHPVWCDFVPCGLGMHSQCSKSARL
jgi:hypothetical protein